MNVFLNAYQSLIPVVQKILMRRAGQPDREASIGLSETPPMVSVMEQHGRSNPRTWNTFQGLLYTDLAAAYAEMEAIDTLSGKTGSEYKRAILKLKDGIATLRRKLEKYQHLIQIGDGTTDMFFDNFLDDSSRETARVYYLDGQGQQLAPIFNASLDHDGESLVLPRVGDISRIRSLRKENVIARFEIDKKFGTRLSMLVNDTGHGPKKAIDKDRSSFWSEVVLADQPVAIKPTWWSIEVRRVLIDITTSAGITERFAIDGLCPQVDDFVLYPVLPNGHMIREWAYTSVYKVRQVLNPVTQTIGPAFDLIAKAGEKVPYTYSHDTLSDFLAMLVQYTYHDQFGGSHVALDDFVAALRTTFSGVSTSVQDFPVEIRYPIADGAACKTHLMFQFNTTANRISLKSFSYGSMELVGMYTIPYDSEKLAFSRGEVNFIVLDPIDLKDIQVIHFPRHECKRIYLLFNQHNYVRNLYHIPTDQKVNMEMWNNLAQAEAEATTLDMALESQFEDRNDPSVQTVMRRNLTLSQRKVDEITGYALFLEYSKRLEELLTFQGTKAKRMELENILNSIIGVLRKKGVFVNPDTLVATETEQSPFSMTTVSAVEYVYGLYDIEVSDAYYSPEGYYITKPYKTVGRAAEFVPRWELMSPPGTAVRAFLSYKHNDTVPVWEEAANGGSVIVHWPDNTDVEPVFEKFMGGKGNVITPTKEIFVHQCARADRVSLRDGWDEVGTTQQIRVGGTIDVVVGSNGWEYWKTRRETITWTATVDVSSMADLGISGNAFESIASSTNLTVKNLAFTTVFASTDAMEVLGLFVRSINGQQVLDLEAFMQLPSVASPRIMVTNVTLDDIEARRTGCIVLFNYAKGSYGANRAYEPVTSEITEGYVPPTAIWPVPTTDGQLSTAPIDVTNQTLRTWAEGSGKNMPIVVIQGYYYHDTGLTDEGTSANFAGDVLLSQDTRVYYRPITMTVRAKDFTFVPDPFGDPYFIEDKTFTIPLKNHLLMTSTLSGAMTGAALTSHIQDQPMVRVLTSGGERDVPLWEVAFFASETREYTARIKDWDFEPVISTDTNDQETISISYSATPITIPKCGVVIVGIKNWVDDYGEPMTIFNDTAVNESHVRLYSAAGVFNGDQVDLVYPVQTEKFKTTDVPKKINVKGDAGYITVLQGWTDDKGNRYPYLGFMAVRLDRFVPHQPVYPDLKYITKNITDYRTTRRPTLKKWNFDINDPDYYPVVEYYHDYLRNRIMFAAQLPTEWNVEMSYCSYAPDVRLKFILDGTVDASPVIDNFKIEVKEE